MIQQHNQFWNIFVVVMLAVSGFTGCSTPVPVTAKFPNPPDRAGGTAMVPCPELKALAADPKLSDVSRTVNVNYGSYYECAVKVDQWIEWYHGQKQIFESAGK